MNKIKILILALALLTPTLTKAAQATLRWEATPQVIVTGFKVFQGTNSGIYNKTITTGVQTNLVVTNLVPGTRYYFAVSSFSPTDTSPLSNEAFYDVPANLAPTAIPQSKPTPRDTSLAITLTGTDPEGSPLTYSITSLPVHGTLTGVPPNIVYQPNIGYLGTDSFTFTATDNESISAPATVTISVVDRPLAPTNLRVTLE